jgi:hypothetical protein
MGKRDSPVRLNDYCTPFSIGTVHSERCNKTTTARRTQLVLFTAKGAIKLQFKPTLELLKKLTIAFVFHYEIYCTTGPRANGIIDNS